MDIPMLEKLAGILQSQIGVFFLIAAWAVSGFYGIWHWHRELVEAKAYGKKWEDRYDKLSGELQAEQRQVVADVRQAQIANYRGSRP